MLPSPSEDAIHPECEAQVEVVLLSSIDSGFSNEVTITDYEEENHHMPPVMQENFSEESQKNSTNSCEGCHSEIPTEVLQEIPLEDSSTFPDGGAYHNNLNSVSEESRFLNPSELAQNISGATSAATSGSSSPQAEDECRAEIYIEEMSQHLQPLISPIPESEEEVEDTPGSSRLGISTFSFSSFGDCQAGVKRKRVDDRLSAIEDTLRQHTNRFDQLYESLERLKDSFDEQVPEDYLGRFIGRFIYETPGLRGRTRLIRAIMHLVADEIEAEELEMSNSEL